MDESSEGRQSAYPIRAVTRVCDLLDLVADAPDGLTLGAAATGAQIPKSTAFRYLASLEARQYVERDQETGSYRLGLAFRPLDTRSRSQLIDVATPLIESLRDQLQETVNLGVLDAGWVVHEAVAEAPQMMRLAARVGDRGYVHSTALGKAICAQLPEERVVAMLEGRGMPRFTATTITTQSAYLAELERVRDQGYGEDDAENQDGGRCVAVAINGIPLRAGLSVSAPSDRFPAADVARVVKELKAAAKKVSAELAT